MLRLLLILTCSSLTGCSILGGFSDAPATMVPAVTTAGSFAKAQSVLIPSGGLTVADLSKQVVRGSHSGLPVVHLQKVPASPGDDLQEKSVSDDRLSHKVVTRLYEDLDLNSVGRYVATAEPDCLNLLTAEEYSTIRPDLLRCVQIYLSDTSSDETALLGKLGDSPINRDSLRASFQAVLVLGVLWNSDLSDRMQNRAVELWQQEYSIGDKNRIDPDMPDTLNVVRQNIDTLVGSGKIDSNLEFKSRLSNCTQFLKDLETQLAARHDKQNIVAAGATPSVTSAPDLRIVSIRFQSGRKVSMPLFLIQDTSAGDVLLSAGDRVEFIAMQESSVFGDAAAADGNVLFVNRGRSASVHLASTFNDSPAALSEFLQGQSEPLRSELSQGPDVVVIRRIERSGKLHDFLIPIPGPGSFSDSAAMSQMLREVHLRQGDQLYLESLERLPIVRESRAAALRFSEQQTKAEAARVAFQQKPLLEKLLQGSVKVLPNNAALLRPQCDTVAAFAPPAISEWQGRVKDALPRPFQSAGDER